MTTILVSIRGGGGNSYGNRIQISNFPKQLQGGFRGNNLTKGFVNDVPKALVPVHKISPA
jgi:hypothetical protein